MQIDVAVVSTLVEVLPTDWKEGWKEHGGSSKEEDFTSQSRLTLLTPRAVLA